MNLKFNLFIFLFAVLRFFALPALVEFWARNGKLAKSWRVHGVNWDENQMKREKKSHLQSFVIDLSCYMVLFNSNIPVFYEETVKRFFITFVFLFIFFELWFYFTHRLFHHPKLFWMHRKHHLSIQTSSWSTFQASWIERLILILGDVGVWILLSHFYPVSLNALFAFVLFVDITGIIGHSDIETVPDKIRLGLYEKIFTTATSHYQHHVKFNVNYGLNTQIIDWIMKTHSHVQDKFRN